MDYYILRYKTQENYLEERVKYRSEHLSQATEYFNEGYLMMAGAMDDPADEALFIFKADSEKIAQAFAKNDPYVRNGLIKEWEVRKWNVVIGN